MQIASKVKEAMESKPFTTATEEQLQQYYAGKPSDEEEKQEEDCLSISHADQTLRIMTVLKKKLEKPHKALHGLLSGASTDKKTLHASTGNTPAEDAAMQSFDSSTGDGSERDGHPDHSEGDGECSLHFTDMII